LLVLDGEGIEGRRTAAAMNIKEGEVFKNSIDGADFIVKKIVNEWVVLQTQDGKRQLLTGVYTLTSTSLLTLKEGEEES
jgi:hypothetical protein